MHALPPQKHFHLHVSALSLFLRPHPSAFSIWQINPKSHFIQCSHSAKWKDFHTQHELVGSVYILWISALMVPVFCLVIKIHQDHIWLAVTMLLSLLWLTQFNQLCEKIRMQSHVTACLKRWWWWKAGAILCAEATEFEKMLECWIRFTNIFQYPAANKALSGKL